MNRIEALAQALTLAVIADNEERMWRATALAQNISSGMSDAQVGRAKAMAVRLLNHE